MAAAVCQTCVSVPLPCAVWLLSSVFMGAEKISRRAADADATQAQDVCPGKREEGVTGASADSLFDLIRLC